MKLHCYLSPHTKINSKWIKDLNIKSETKNYIGDIEVKNNLTIARGEWGGDSGKRGLQELL